MAVAVIGISHHTAPLALRERVHFRAGEAEQALVELVTSGAVEEAVLLSTCNRTELYVRTEGWAPGMEAAGRLLESRGRLTPEERTRYLYLHAGNAGVQHLFRVTGGLDSMIVGEAQIQGQVRDAYELALSTQPRAVGPVLSRMLEMALSVGGRIRSDTELGRGAASIPSAAVELARKIFGALRGRRVLVIGTGEMAELALQCLASEGADCTVLSRTLERAAAAASPVGARAAAMDELDGLLPGAEIVLSATAAPVPILTAERLSRAFPGGPREPLLVLDIAVPRDVEAAAGSLDNVFLYDLDDLQQVVQGNVAKRQQAAAAAERLVEDGVAEFWRWYTSRDAVPVIRALRSRAEDLRRHEVEKALRKLGHLSEDDRSAVEQLTRQLLAKVLHNPTVRLREAASSAVGDQVLDAARYLFELDAQDRNGMEPEPTAEEESVAEAEERAS